LKTSLAGKELIGIAFSCCNVFQICCFVISHMTQEETAFGINLDETSKDDMKNKTALKT